MIIGKPAISSSSGGVRVSVPVHTDSGSSYMWYEVDQEHADLVIGASSDPFLAGLLIIAMKLREPLVVAGVVSEKLKFNLQRNLQPVMCELIPDLECVSITADGAAEARAGNGVATGFSAGVDSFAVVSDHFLSTDVRDSPGFRLTHLLFNSVGSVSAGPARVHILREIAGSWGLPLVAIRSNIDQFYRPLGLKYQQTHTLRNASAAMLLQNRIDRYLYASSHPYGEVCVQPTPNISFADPLILPLLSTESLEAHSVGGAYTRVAKTMRIAGLKEAQAHLNVCVASDPLTNCSRCFKCMRTMLTLEIVGALERFGGVFDLDMYAKYRIPYMGEVIAYRGAPFMREIRLEAKERSFEFPAAAYAHAAMYTSRSAARKAKSVLSSAARPFRTVARA